MLLQPGPWQPKEAFSSLRRASDALPLWRDPDPAGLAALILLHPGSGSSPQTSGLLPVLLPCLTCSFPIHSAGRAFSARAPTLHTRTA